MNSQVKKNEGDGSPVFTPYDPLELQNRYLQQVNEARQRRPEHPLPEHLEAVGLQTAEESVIAEVAKHQLESNCSICAETVEWFREHADHIHSLPDLDC